MNERQYIYIYIYIYIYRVTINAQRIYSKVLLTNILVTAEFPVSLPSLSVAFTSKPYSFPPSRVNVTIDLTIPERGSI